MIGILNRRSCCQRHLSTNALLLRAIVELHKKPALASGAAECSDSTILRQWYLQGIPFTCVLARTNFMPHRCTGGNIR